MVMQRGSNTESRENKKKHKQFNENTSMTVPGVECCKQKNYVLQIDSNSANKQLKKL